jgi:hypothetical protein
MTGTVAVPTRLRNHCSTVCPHRAAFREMRLAGWQLTMQYANLESEVSSKAAVSQRRRALA